MTATQPFSLRIFVADGDPDGLRLVERSNWIGKLGVDAAVGRFDNCVDEDMAEDLVKSLMGDMK